MGRAIWHGVDCLDPWWIESLMENSVFTMVNLSDVRVIMTIMHVHVVELFYQATMGRISVLKWLLSHARGCLWSCPIMTDIKYRHFLRTQLQRLFLVLGSLGCDCRGPGYVSSRVMRGSTVNRHVVKSCSSVFIVMGEMIGTDHSRVWFFLGWRSLLLS
jgi:hypothetical protein